MSDPTVLVPPLTLALYQPDIPQNAGTLLRTCACLGVAAVLIEPAGFPTSDRHFRRAGIDYLDGIALSRYASFAAFDAWRRACATERRLVLLSTAGDVCHWDARYHAGDILMVGRESAGVPPSVHAAAPLSVRIPMQPGLRSLNVAVAGAIVMAEALRQLSRSDITAKRIENAL